MSPAKPVQSVEREFSLEARRSLASTSVQRRRQMVSEDPSLLFGSAVFAQLVASDLARSQVEEGLVSLVESESGEDAQELAVEAGSSQGFFGGVASAGSVAPVLGVLGVIAGVPGPSSSGVGGASASQDSSNNPAGTDGTGGQTDSKSSVVARNASGARRGQQPNADGAEQASPEREVSGAQATATETQQEFTGSGGNPFGAGVPADATDVPQTDRAQSSGSMIAELTAPVGAIADVFGDTLQGTAVNMGEGETGMGSAMPVGVTSTAAPTGAAGFNLVELVTA